MRREAVPCERVMVVVSAGQGAELRVCAERYKSKTKCQLHAGTCTHKTSKRFSSRPVTTGRWLMCRYGVSLADAAREPPRAGHTGAFALE